MPAPPMLGSGSLHMSLLEDMLDGTLSSPDCALGRQLSQAFPLGRQGWTWRTDNIPDLYWFCML